MDDKEIYDYYVEPFDDIGQALDLSAAMLFPHDPPSLRQYPGIETKRKYALERGMNALFRFAYCDLLLCPGKNPYHYKKDKKIDKEYSLIYCIEMIIHQHNPLYINNIWRSWHGHEAWITDEGEQFYAENENNLLKALTKRFKDYGVGFEKGYILKSPETPPNVKPITIF